MAKKKPTVKKLPSQTSLDKDANNFIYRVLPPWNLPSWKSAGYWRKFVSAQPVAVICRYTLITHLLALDWRIIPRDSTQIDELKPLVERYTKLFEYNNGLSFEDRLEMLGKDILDLPFGCAMEVGRKGNNKSGDIVWLEPLDGGTLFPTLDPEIPVGQYIPESSVVPVYFPAYSIAHAQLSPKSDFKQRGWGLAPPERIYMAIQLLSRGDQYYANLLIDTPEAGLLDLGDMARTAAESWINSFRDLMVGVNPFKIPVLYEHNNPVKWIPFGRPPTEIMFNDVTTKYASLVCAGYGLTLGDIGITAKSNGGDSLAGSIRQERKSRRTGQAMIKKKFTAMFNQILPESLKFVWIDYDDELNVAMSRARLANATAAEKWINSGVFEPNEIRQQIITDGLFTISLPEKIENPQPADKGKGIPARDQLGRPVPVSSGGHGEVRLGIVQEFSDPQLYNELKTQLSNYPKEYLEDLSEAILDNTPEDFIPLVEDVYIRLENIFTGKGGTLEIEVILTNTQKQEVEILAKGFVSMACLVSKKTQDFDCVTLAQALITEYLNKDKESSDD